MVCIFGNLFTVLYIVCTLKLWPYQNINKLYQFCPFIITFFLISSFSARLSFSYAVYVTLVYGPANKLPHWCFSFKVFLTDLVVVPYNLATSFTA